MRARPTFRRVIVGVATGVLMVSAAWAGTGLAPIDRPDTSDASDTSAVEAGTADAADDTASDAVDVATETGTTTSLNGSLRVPEDPGTFHAPGTVALPDGAVEDGWYHVGAAKVNLYPNPDAYDGTWERDADACSTFPPSSFDDLTHGADHVVTAGSPWNENPDCIYMGGFGLGPMNPIVEFDDEYGLWVRTVAIHDGADPLFLTVIDAEGWFWDYNDKCDDCGFKQISERLAEEFGVDPSAFIFHSTHSHAAMDFIGGWGFVPDWYMQQATDSVEESVRRAVGSMEPARLEIGEATARHLNRERRDTYHSPEEQQLAWLRAYVPGETTTTAPGGSAGKGDGDGANETTTTTPPRTIATVGTYAAHPVSMGTNDGVAHADWPGAFAVGVEERFGGVGMNFMTGLGNMSTAGGLSIGGQLAALVTDVGTGSLISDTDVRTGQTIWNQPTTNVPLTALGAPGFFDRRFQETPAQVRTGKNPDEAPCLSAAPVSVEVAASAAWIGEDLVVTAGPGEMFSNSTNTIKEKAAAAGAWALPIAQANDALGYLPESFERADNPASGEGAGFADSGPLYIEYEDAYSIDRCFGDMNLETTLALMGTLR